MGMWKSWWMKWQPGLLTMSCWSTRGGCWLSGSCQLLPHLPGADCWQRFWTLRPAFPACPDPCPASWNTWWSKCNNWRNKRRWSSSDSGWHTCSTTGETLVSRCSAKKKDSIHGILSSPEEWSLCHFRTGFLLNMFIVAQAFLTFPKKLKPKKT